jgi:hypothetical protein
MKTVRFVIPVFSLVLFLTTTLYAQLPKNFAGELTAVLKADLSAIKGGVEERQSDATIYQTKLKLTGFGLTYAETPFGNDFHAKYLQAASMELMDAIAAALHNAVFVTTDSKIDPKVLGRGMFASDLQRKITVKMADAAKWRANITLDKSNVILIVFLKEQ